MRRIYKILILLLNFGSVYGQKEFVAKKIKTDLENYSSVIRTLKDTSLLKNPELFFKSFVSSKIELTKNQDFGLSLIKCLQNGVYTNDWITALVYKNEIIEYEVRFFAEDSAAIDYILSKNNSVKAGMLALNKGGPYVFSYTNTAKYINFKRDVTEYTGLLKSDLNFKSKDSKVYFDVLTNPMKNYDYGARCYYEGDYPIGRKAIRHFVSLRDTTTIREILKGYNPEGRLYATEALMALAKYKEVRLTGGDKRLIRMILASKILINTCQGCIGLTMPAAELIKIPEDYSNENKVIKEENEIGKEQGWPTRGPY